MYNLYTSLGLVKYTGLIRVSKLIMTKGKRAFFIFWVFCEITRGNTGFDRPMLIFFMDEKVIERKHNSADEL